METERKPNRLIHETSPYLLQHALNPVDWHTWGEEAILRACREDKPIFLSIGYSACHWCHVMESESFENREIAGLMNDLFVNIKVDREERPDLDRIYMTAVQMISGSGGWPMSVFLTPDLKPFYGGTYFPPDDRWGRPGFPRVLGAVAEAYRTRRDDVERSAAEITERIRDLAAMSRPDSLLSPALLDGAAANLASSFDPVHGGFGGAPKFPQSQALRLLLRRFARTGDISALRIVRTTLDAMARGGIYDHVGGGFHRYSTDERWLVPHFEKMLYDQALLSLVYLEAFQITGEAEYARIARETLGYLAREMTAPGGGFYAAEDADDPGGEGYFYTWTPRELRDALGDEDADLVSRAYDVDDVGNFEGRSILHRLKSDTDLASINGAGEGKTAVRADEIGARLAVALEKLLAARAKRSRPLRDEKVLADWNGLAIAAFARGARVLDEPDLLARAGKAARFILSQLRDADGNLLHVWKDGDAKIAGFLEDHASLLNSTIDLYEASGEQSWLAEASAIARAAIENFWDAGSGGFTDTGPLHRDLIARTRHADDHSTPSGNGLIAYGLIRLSRITGEAEWLEKGSLTLRAFVPTMEAIPAGTCQTLLALDLFLAPPQEVALIGSGDAEGMAALRRIVDRLFLPHTVVLQEDGSGRSALAGLAGKRAVDGRAAAYVCGNFACQSPVTTPEALEAALRR